MDGGSRDTTMNVPGALRSPRLRPWFAALGYLVVQALVAVLDIHWGPLGGIQAQALLVVVGCGALVFVGGRPEGFQSRWLRTLVLSLGWPLAVIGGGVAMVEPYVFNDEAQWLGQGTQYATLNPFFTGGLTWLLFLVALGYAGGVGTRVGRWLCLGMPLFVFLALCWILHLRGYPAFEG
jgi:hypothetical protein